MVFRKINIYSESPCMVATGNRLRRQTAAHSSYCCCWVLVFGFLFGVFSFFLGGGGALFCFCFFVVACLFALFFGFFSEIMSQSLLILFSSHLLSVLCPLSLTSPPPLSLSLSLSLSLPPSLSFSPLSHFLWFYSSFPHLD